MALLNPTFIFGVIVVAYFSSFVLFAILRILTGISIQRVGYLSLRRLAYIPRDGVKIEIRGLGLNLHRPTFAQPTWISIVLTELAVTVDWKAAEVEKPGENGGSLGEFDDEGSESEEESIRKPRPLRTRSSDPHRSKSWEHLTSIKERIKRLHRNINWIRMVDLVVNNSTVTVVDVGNIQLGSFTMAVDTRRKRFDRGRMFSRLRAPKKKEQRPAEWIITVRSVLFTPEGRDSLEILDHSTLNIHGFLYRELDGLRDASISLKLGRVHIPYDEIKRCIARYQACLNSVPGDSLDVTEMSFASDLINEIDRPGSQEENLVRTVSDSKEFISSILRGIKEVQFAVSLVGFTKIVSSVQPHGSPIYLHASMKEVGIDLHRLDQKSPAHRMYFSSKDVAHQALAAALSIAVGVDDGHGKTDRLVYIPMTTTTVRTTLPSKTVEFAGNNSADERNANILFANVVITSPSLDLDPKHLSLVLGMMQSTPQFSKGMKPRKHTLISRLLPKASVKLSMHEPVVRIALPPVDKTVEEDDFDLIISSISSISLDIESSHTAIGELHYSLGSTFRLQSHALYYQTSSGARYDLLETESLELKAQLSANPEVYVVATGNLQTFSIHMIRPEITDGVRQIVRQLHLNVEPEKRVHSKSSRDPNFIRVIPPWLVRFSIQGSDFSAEVAGVDEDISDGTRGVALQLQSWTAEYHAQKNGNKERRESRRRTASRSLTPDEALLSMPTSPRTRQQQQHPTDGRRLFIQIEGLEALVVESTDKWEPEPFVTMPRFEVTLSTLSDNQGPVFHISSQVKWLLVHYSLYRHYACEVAMMILRRAFARTKADQREAQQARAIVRKPGTPDVLSPIMSSDDFFLREAPDYYPSTTKELITIDVKSTLVQIKATMPADPEIMLRIYDMQAGRHRWSPPFINAKLARMYAEAPRVRRVWARIVSLRTPRLDQRQNRRKKSNGEMLEETLFAVNTDAIRLAIPHQLVIHKVLDNVINTLKSVQQLHHRFATGSNEYILEKQPERPKQLPKISIRSKALLFELEDGAFEWKLGTIYRTGLVEQAQRLARMAAFDVKAKMMEEEDKRKDSSRYRNRSAHLQARSKPPLDQTHRRSLSEDGLFEEESRSRSRRGRCMRYNPDGAYDMSDSAKISIDEAYDRMQRHNAQSWKQRIDRVFSQSKDGMKELRGVFWSADQLPEGMEESETILEIPQRPALMATLISDLRVMIEKPSFPMHTLPDFIHRIGKGMPHDMQYALLVPMHVRIDMGEARVTLRDYPLPLLHVPAIKPGQSSRSPSWSLKADFVIAEEFRGPESMRQVRVDIIPPQRRQSGTKNESGFAIDVRRTVSPVKSYSDINVDINTGFPTRITWGASFQPAIQDMMMIIETFTKPQTGPSDRAGFWDKIRLSFHSRVSVAWKGDGDVHLMLKGTRDPYAITGNGAGFLMCWRNDVRWNICRDDDPRKFMTVDSGEYILAIPDYSHQARSFVQPDYDRNNIASADRFKRGAVFKKVVMKLSGNVQWVAGLMFERNTGKAGERSFEFAPHYSVVMKRPDCARSTGSLPYDAFRGFRSHHIHLSIAVKAPVDRVWSVSNTQKSLSYNTVHLSPRFFSHFFAWWSMFGGTMSLPIRQGALWPGIEKSSKKFGRHLASIKYNLLLAPLFISHIYKHKGAEDCNENVVSATGLKIRLDNFMLDVHQRREEFPTHDSGRKMQGKTSGMKMHQAQLDLLSADIRAVTASMAGTTPDDLRAASIPISNLEQDDSIPDLSNFEIPDNDFTWIDMDDFVELDWILPSKANPTTKILPLAYAPRFTYFRQTDRGDKISGDPDRKSPFGHEPTHFCIMKKDDDSRRVQCELIKARMEQLEKQMESHTRALGDAELRLIQNQHSDVVRAEYEQLKKHGGILLDKKLFLESMVNRMATRLHTGQKHSVSDDDADVSSDGEIPAPRDCDSTAERIDTNLSADFVSDFNNRFVIHNMQLKWNNLLRNIILRYIHQVSQRRGFVYYLSRRAVKFLLDIVEEQNKPKQSTRNSTAQTKSTPMMTPASGHHEDTGYQDVENRIKEILSDGKTFVNANDRHTRAHYSSQRVSVGDLDAGISGDFVPQNSYHLRLIAPQIQLQSEKNPKAVVLVTAKGMEAKVVEVMDKDRVLDNVSGLVQRRFSVEMDSTQFFVTHQKWFSSQMSSMYSGNHYGVPAGSPWPPWVPMEVIFDFQVDPFGFKRVVQKTSASLRFEKYNTLRLKYNDEISRETGHRSSTNSTEENRMDHVWVEFPQIRAICNSAQYYAMYIIVMDLLMYSEPLEKTRTERLEKIMLASDFSDLRGAPELVIRLQERIRQLEEIKTQFQINSENLDRRGWEDRLLLDRDLTSCEDELFFMMKAITTSQRKYDASQTSGLLRWNISSKQIVWHLIRDNQEPLMEFQLQKAEYDRTDNSDGSHINFMQIGKIIGLNLLPDAIYPEMIAPYSDINGKTSIESGNQRMLGVYWYMLEPIAGISVMDHFEVNLFPIKIQLEREVGKRLFDYMFPGNSERNKSRFKVQSLQALQDKDGDENDDHDDEDDDDDENHHGDEDDEDSYSLRRLRSRFNKNNVILASKQDSVSHTRAGSLEHRLKPTMTSETMSEAGTLKKRTKSLHNDGHHFRLFPSPPSKTSVGSRAGSARTLMKKLSNEGLQGGGGTHPVIRRSLTTHSAEVHSMSTGDSHGKRFGISRTGSKTKNKQPCDDLTKMMTRASSYTTIAYVKIPSVALCLSYKGKGERNLEDVHDLVFRLPEIEYRNKTWSNLELALALKRDVIRSLISHTGAIVANKFSKHRPNMAQQHRLRELATHSMVLTASGQDNSHENSDANSSYRTSSPTASRSERSSSPHRSFTSSQHGLTRTPSDTSSLSNQPTRSIGLHMTRADSVTLSDKTASGSSDKTSSVKKSVLSRLMKKGNPVTRVTGSPSAELGHGLVPLQGAGPEDGDSGEKKKKRSRMLTLGSSG